MPSADTFRTFDQETDACASAAALAYGVKRSERTPAVRLALAGMKAQINDLERRIIKLNQMLAQAETLADHDVLVPIYNRRGFMRELKSFLKLSCRQEIPACLACFDLDGFKLINDRYGHAAGDLVLKGVGTILNDQTRESDITGRLGGDEFAVLLTHIDFKAAQAKADELVASIQAMRIPHENKDLRIGVSLGLSSLNASEDADTQIARADRAMYANKAQQQKARA